MIDCYNSRLTRSLSTLHPGFSGMYVSNQLCTMSVQRRYAIEMCTIICKQQLHQSSSQSSTRNCSNKRSPDHENLKQNISSASSKKCTDHVQLPNLDSCDCSRQVNEICITQIVLTINTRVLQFLNIVQAQSGNPFYTLIDISSWHCNV